MNGEGEESDVDEKHVSEHALEDILLSLLQLSGVDLVENLHENECLEHKSEVEALLGGVSSLELLWQEVWLIINDGLDLLTHYEAVEWKFVILLPGVDVFGMGSLILITCERS